MSQHHRKAGWGGATVRTARARIAAGPSIQACIRCGGPIRIADNHTWDAGHVIDLAHGGDAKRYGPEHRRCNRRAGGKAGARITNHRPAGNDDRLPNW